MRFQSRVGPRVLKLNKKSITKFTTFQSWLGSPQLLGVQRCMSGHNFYMFCDSTRAWEISKKQFVHPPFCMSLLEATWVGQIGNGPVSLSPLMNTEIFILSFSYNNPNRSPTASYFNGLHTLALIFAAAFPLTNNLGKSYPSK